MKYARNCGLDRNKELLKKLGKYKAGKSCLYVKKLDDIDKSVLTEIIKESVKYIKNYKEFPHSRI